MEGSLRQQKREDHEKFLDWTNLTPTAKRFRSTTLELSSSPQTQKPLRTNR